MPDMKPNEELAGLLKAISEDRLSPEQHERLEAILRDDPEARKRYLRYIQADALLAWRYAHVPDLPADLGTGEEVTQSIVSLPDRRRETAMMPTWRGALKVAAVLIVGLLLGLPLGWLFNRRVPDERLASAPNGEAVAVLASVNGDVRWNKAQQHAEDAGQRVGQRVDAD